MGSMSRRLVFVLPGGEDEGRKEEGGGREEDEKGEERERVERVKKGSWIKVGLERWSNEFWISVHSAPSLSTGLMNWESKGVQNGDKN